MKKIYKYQIIPQDFQALELPEGSKILSVSEQYNNIVLHALVNPDIEEIDIYDIAVKGTGHDFPKKLDTYTFLGTVKLMNGALMFHIFYKKVKWRFRNVVIKMKEVDKRVYEIDEDEFRDKFPDIHGKIEMCYFNEFKRVFKVVVELWRWIMIL